MSIGASDNAHASTSADDAGSPPADATPYFTVTRGNPTREEVGILAALFATAEGNALNADEDPTAIRDHWGSYKDRLRPPFGYNPSSFLNRRTF